MTERSCLGAISEHRQWLLGQCLTDEIRQRSAVVEAHPWAISIEDPDDPGVDSVASMVGQRHRLGKSLRLIVDPSDANRIHIAPIRFWLRVNQRIAINLAGTGQQELCTTGFCQSQRLVGPEGADLEGLDRIFLVIDGACRRCEVKDGIDLGRDMDELGDIMADELESWIPEEMLDVSNISREQIIHHHDFAISAEE